MGVNMALDERQQPGPQEPERPAQGSQRKRQELCDDQPGGNCDTDGKPNVLTLLYNGNSCAEASNCSDGHIGQDLMHRRSGRRAAGAHHRQQQFQSAHGRFGALLRRHCQPEPQFEVRSSATGDDSFGSNTYFHIFSGSTLVQTIQIHTSCSAPLRRGETFGSLVLLDYRIDP